MAAKDLNTRTRWKDKLADLHTEDKVDGLPTEYKEEADKATNNGAEKVETQVVPKKTLVGRMKSKEIPIAKPGSWEEAAAAAGVTLVEHSEGLEPALVEITKKRRSLKEMRTAPVKRKKAPPRSQIQRKRCLKSPITLTRHGCRKDKQSTINQPISCFLLKTMYTRRGQVVLERQARLWHMAREHFWRNTWATVSSMTKPILSSTKTALIFKERKLQILHR